MPRMSSLWSLYNLVERHRIDDLPLSHLLIVIPTIPPARIGDWVAWRPGAKDWQPLHTFPELEQTLATLQHVYEATGSFPMQRPDEKPLFADTVQRHQERTFADYFDESNMGLDEGVDAEDSNDELELELDERPQRDRRRARRFKKDWVVEVRIGRNQFVSHTSDISLKGMRIRDSLPDWVPLQFQAIIMNNGHALTILCSRIQRTKSQVRIEAVSTPNILKQWLMKG